MGNRRFAQVSTSDDEDEETRLPSTRKESENWKKLKVPEEEQDAATEKKDAKSALEASEETKEEADLEEEENEELQEDAKPLGQPIKYSGKGNSRRSHYLSFEFDDNQYDLEDPVLLVPEDKAQKPYVAIIKDIARDKDGNVMVTGQWFYRPDEAEKNGGGSWPLHDRRELFYSFHRDEVPAESVMHKCVVHFIPVQKQIPRCKQHPGFIVQKVYDTVERKLWNLTDKDYEDNKQHEIDLLVQKTLSHLGDLPDMVAENTTAHEENQVQNKRTLKRKNSTSVDVSKEEAASLPSNPKAEAAGRSITNPSDHHSIIQKFKVRTGDAHRDKWLEKLLQSVQHVCTSANDRHGSQDTNSESVNVYLWPDAAVAAVVSLEKASHEVLSCDFQKYNQKMRQLAFNLKNSALLAQRLLNGELEPSKVLNMSPNELKEGLTKEESMTKEPEESECMQMTNARCSRCNELRVGVRDIIQAGYRDRYQLECCSCGNSWYASRDDVSMQPLNGPSPARAPAPAPGPGPAVGAPWSSSKADDVQKKTTP